MSRSAFYLFRLGWGQARLSTKASYLFIHSRYQQDCKQTFVDKTVVSKNRFSMRKSRFCGKMNSSAVIILILIAVININLNELKEKKLKGRNLCRTLSSNFGTHK